MFVANWIYMVDYVFYAKYFGSLGCAPYLAMVDGN
jgi:hypothetical protein